MQRPTTEQVSEKRRAVFRPGFAQDITAAVPVEQIQEGIRQVTSATITALAGSIEREQTRRWELPGRVAGVEQRVNPSK